jgi:hypothetical protein
MSWLLGRDKALFAWSDIHQDCQLGIQDTLHQGLRQACPTFWECAPKIINKDHMMNTKRIRLPYGISNFQRLVRDGYYFIDKSNYIEKLEENPEPYIFFLRPRRFGKSLFVSQLRYYYGLEYKDQFDTIFGHYYIGKHPTPGANKYHVLHFEFSRIDTRSKDSTFQYPPFYPKYQFLFEIKYLNKAGEKSLNTTTHKAIAQVNEYLAFDEISSLKNLKAYVLIFVGSEIKVVEEIG